MQSFTPVSKSPGALRTIREVSDLMALAPSVLRFWETQFDALKPLKLRGNRRYYRPQDIAAARRIKHLLYSQGYTIKGARDQVHVSQKEQAMSDSIVEMDLLGEIKPKKARKPRATKNAALELVTPQPLTVDEEKRQRLVSVKTELHALKDLLQPYL